MSESDLASSGQSSGKQILLDSVGPKPTVRKNNGIRLICFNRPCANGAVGMRDEELEKETGETDR